MNHHNGPLLLHIIVILVNALISHRTIDIIIIHVMMYKFKIFWWREIEDWRICPVRQPNCCSKRSTKSEASFL